jgi:hypothetical protein
VFFKEFSFLRTFNRTHIAPTLCVTRRNVPRFCTPTHTKLLFAAFRHTYKKSILCSLHGTNSIFIHNTANTAPLRRYTDFTKTFLTFKMSYDFTLRVWTWLHSRTYRVQASLHWFAWTSQTLSIIWTSAPNFAQSTQEIWKLRPAIHLHPSVKSDCHCTDFDNFCTHLLYGLS